MSVTKLAKELGAASIRLGYDGTVAILDHVGGIQKGTYDPEADSIKARYGFNEKGVGTFVDKRFSEEVLGFLVTHPSNPLGVSDELNSRPQADVQAEIARDAWIPGDFRRLSRTNSSLPMWDEFIEPAWKRLSPAPVEPPKPSVEPPVVVPPAKPVVAWKRPPMKLAGHLEQMVGWPNLNEGQRVLVSRLATRMSTYVDAYLAAHPEAKVGDDD